jgi:hypothetical protein
MWFDLDFTLKYVRTEHKDEETKEKETKKEKQIFVIYLGPNCGESIGRRQDYQRNCDSHITHR